MSSSEPKAVKPVREIVTCGLVYVSSLPIVLLIDLKKANLVVEAAKKKGKDAFLKKLQLPKHRFDEIGKNLFQITKNMKKDHIARILEVREKLVRAAMDLRDSANVDIETAWGDVAKKAGPPYDKMDYSEFNQFTLDISHFVLWQR